MKLLHDVFHRWRRVRPQDRSDAEELRHKYGAEARSRADARARDRNLPARTRKHWRRVSHLL
jgi:hypothetical protein